MFEIAPRAAVGIGWTQKSQIAGGESDWISGEARKEYRSHGKSSGNMNVVSLLFSEVLKKLSWICWDVLFAGVLLLLWMILHVPWILKVLQHLHVDNLKSEDHFSLKSGTLSAIQTLGWTPLVVSPFQATQLHKYTVEQHVTNIKGTGMKTSLCAFH